MGKIKTLFKTLHLLSEG